MSNDALELDDRKRRELDYHNSRFAADPRGTVIESSSADKFYAVASRSRDAYTRALLADCKGRRVLEYGCGMGSLGLVLAKHGADVTGIDLSDVAVSAAQRRAAAEGLDVDFRVMDAERLQFPAHSFDVICGSAILHHLDLRRSYVELARTLHPNGVAVFLEPLGHNPLINLYRRLTPGLRTPDEHPLTMKDFRLAREFFGKVELRCFHLLSLLAVPLRRTRLFPRLLSFLTAVDSKLFEALPTFKRFAWTAVVTLANPKKSRV